MRNARQVALDILSQLHRKGKTIDHWIERADPQIRRLQRADRAFAHALVYGTLRWQGRLDFMINQLARNPSKIDPLVRVILRMALFQMNHMERVPHSAAVHTAVELAKQNGHKWAAGFVNGVLRRAAAAPDDIVWPSSSQGIDLALAIEHSFPVWLTRRWIERFGLDGACRLCEAINTIPSITVRTNTLKTDRVTLIKKIEEETGAALETQYTPEGIQLGSLARPMTQWAAYRDGWFQVQNEAAQLVSHVVAPKPGESVWDACAGLGTKSAHLAQIMEDQGTIVATDLQPSKLERLAKEMVRLGITSVTPRSMDLTNARIDDRLTPFDKILVDAPCSGLGVLQKNPDGKWRVTEDEIFRAAARQAAILDRVALHLRVGGALTYAVCSFEPEENEGIVEGFLQKHPGFAIDIPQMTATSQANRLITSEGFLRTFPHNNSMDGFFAARFVRKS